MVPAVVLVLVALCSYSCTVHSRPLPSPLMYPNERLPHSNKTVFAIANTKYAYHVFARGKDNLLYHKYSMKDNFSIEAREAFSDSGPWTDWIMRAQAPNGSWDSDPACGVNPDGSIEVFIRYSTNLDMWQMYQTDPTDPNAWSDPRECSCVDVGNCQNANNSDPNAYWNTQPIFPTSDIQIMNAADGSLNIYYRGFNGKLNVIAQKDPVSHKYWPPMQFPVVLE